MGISAHSISLADRPTELIQCFIPFLQYLCHAIVYSCVLLEIGGIAVKCAFDGLRTVIVSSAPKHND